MGRGAGLLIRCINEDRRRPNNGLRLACMNDPSDAADVIKPLAGDQWRPYGEGTSLESDNFRTLPPPGEAVTEGDG